MLGLKAQNCVGTVTFRNVQRALFAKKKPAPEIAPEIAPGVTFSGIFLGMRFLFMWGVGETKLVSFPQESFGFVRERRF